MRVRLLILFFLLLSLISWGSPPTLQEWTQLRLDFQISFTLLREGSLILSEDLLKANGIIVNLNSNLAKAKTTQEDSNEIIVNLNNSLSAAKITQQNSNDSLAGSQQETIKLSKDLNGATTLNSNLQSTLKDYRDQIIEEAEKMAKQQRWNKIIFGGLVVICIGEAIGIGLILLSR